MPAPYREAQNEMRRQLKQQWAKGPLEGPLAVHVLVQGEGRGDADNIAGAFMDAGHDILWTDDRVSVISELCVRWRKRPKAESQWIITIYELSETTDW
jgi:Holliday junction resolvase RusA-like endonuclease